MSFLKPDPARAAEVAARLKQKISEATARKEKARVDFEAASLAVDENVPGAEVQRDNARKALENAEAEIFNTMAALAGAESRYAQALEAHKELELSQRWDQVLEIVPRRVELAREIESHVKALVDKFRQLAALSEQQYALIPVKKESILDGKLASGKVEEALRLHLVKSGFRWAYHRWPWPSEETPTLSSAVEEGNAWSLKGKNTNERKEAV